MDPFNEFSNVNSKEITAHNPDGLPPRKKNKKNKKKNNFLRNIKKHGKRGTYGRGELLSDAQYNYYINIFELLKQETGEERELLVQNFLTNIIEEEESRKLICNQIISRILDDVLPLAEMEKILALIEIFSADLRTLSLDPYGSHVLQTLISLAFKYSQKKTPAKPVNAEPSDEFLSLAVKEKEEVAATDDEKQLLISFLEKVGKYFYNNLDEFIRDTYGSHVFRSLLEACSGVQMEASVKSSQKSQSTHDLCIDKSQITQIPPQMKTLLEDIVNRLMMLPDFPGIIANESSSASLQGVLQVLKGSEKLSGQLIDHIISNGFDEMTAAHCDQSLHRGLPFVFQSRSTTRLLESAISYASNDYLNKIYCSYFKDHMQNLVSHHLGNFAVQKLLLSWKTKDTFPELFDKVQELLPQAYESKHTGIIHALAQACQKIGKNQGQCWKSISELLNCYQPQERQNFLTPCLLWFLTYEEYQKKREEGNLPPVSLHGSLIIQEILKYTKPLKVVESILAMDIVNLKLMACDPRGSHIVDAFFSNSIRLASKTSLIDLFKGSYVTLACSKHGSRSLEAMWKEASVTAKTDICTELSNEEIKLKGNPHGTIIYNKFMVRVFSRNDKRDWKELVDGQAKKKRMLDGLLNDISEPKSKKKKKKKKHEEN